MSNHAVALHWGALTRRGTKGSAATWAGPEKTIPPIDPQFMLKEFTLIISFQKLCHNFRRKFLPHVSSRLLKFFSRSHRDLALASFQGPSRRNVPLLHSSRRSCTVNTVYTYLHCTNLYLYVIFVCFSDLLFGTVHVCSHVFILHAFDRCSDSEGLHVDRISQSNVGNKVIIQTSRGWNWFCICISFWTNSCRKTWN